MKLAHHPHTRVSTAAGSASRNLREHFPGCPALATVAVLLLATAGAHGAPAEVDRFAHETWSVADGLPVSGLTQLIQTRDGYLWLATFDGLVRFDGVRLHAFTTGNSDGLPSNRIVEVRETADGSLWLRTEQYHAVRFHEGRFTAFGPAQGFLARALAEDEEGTLWIGADKGIWAFRNEELEHVEIPGVEGGVTALLTARDGALWIGTSHGALRVRDGEVERLSVEDGLPRLHVVSLHEDQAGAIWIVTHGGASRYAEGELVWKSPLGPKAAPKHLVVEVHAGPRSADQWFSAEDGLRPSHDGMLRRVVWDVSAYNPLQRFSTDREGHLWYSVRNVVYRDDVPIYRIAPEDEALAAATSIVADHEGSIWIATATRGLHRLKPSVFRVYGEAEGLVSRNIYPVLEDSSGNLWCGTWGSGVHRLVDGEMETFLPGKYILSLHEDSRGRVFIGGTDGVLCRLEDGKCETFGADEVGRGAEVYAIHEDPEGALWFGANTGLFRLRDGEWERFAEESGLAAGWVRVFHETRDGALWMGTNGAGLIRYRDGDFARLTAADGLSSDLIRALYEDEDGHLWIGTEGRGLCRLRGADLDDPAIDVVRQADGLFDEVIHQILEDDFGRLWMSTNRGIFWVLREELAAFADGRAGHVVSTSYDERDGMRSREANGGMSPAGIRASDGRLWFPTQDGAVVVDPARIRRNEVPPPVVIEELRAGGAPVSHRAAPVRLAADQRDFEISYTALSFLTPENVRFRYRLEGYNEDWVEAGARRVAYYTNVPPGLHRFHVIAQNNDGVWNEEGASLEVVISPRFVETRTFQAASIIGLALLVSAGWGLRVRRARHRERELEVLVSERSREAEREREAAEHQRRVAENALQTVEKQAERLRELDETKSRFFANISHEFRTPLTLTIGPLEDLLAGTHGPLDEDMTEEVAMALRNSRRLLLLVNEILDVAKLEAGQMRLYWHRTSLREFLEALTLPFFPLAERRRIRFEVDLPEEDVEVHVDPDLLEKVFGNLLSNAFKFTPEEGTVRLSVDVRAQDGEPWGVAVSVRDSGPGIPSAELPHIFERFYQVAESSRQWQSGTGIGLSLAKELTELHGGRLEVETEDGFGSTFTVRLRLGFDHLEGEPREAEPREGADRGTPLGRSEWPQEGEAAPAAEPAPRETGLEDSEDVPTLLVVEDNADVRAYVRKHLAPRYRVVEAADGKEGLEAARRTLPDLIISDVMMPEMDGYELCAALKADRDLDYVPVILLTARATTGDKVHGLDRGADDYLTKPFEIRELEARIANLIGSRQALRERFSVPGARLHSTPVAVKSSDYAFLERIRSVIEDGMSDETFGVESLAAGVGLSRGHLHRRLVELSSETPTQVIRRLRLERAGRLLAGRSGSVSEVAYGVGFKSVSHFSRCFREQFGVTPSDHAGTSDGR